MEGGEVRAIDAIRRSGVGIEPHRSVRDAAVVMERSGVGSLAVIEGTQLLGIVTDRDLVRRVLACALPADSRVDGVMSSPVITIAADADVHDAFALFGAHGVRRLAVVRDEQFMGTITIDDLLVDLAIDLGNLARPISHEMLFAHHDAELPATV
jgi:CBS domain-containing protein